MKSRKGFTLIELLIVIGVIAVLAGVVIVAINPARQFALARNARRWSNLKGILGGIGERTAFNKGVFETGCAAGAIPTTTKKMAVGSGNYDIAPCLVPDYMNTMFFDPSAPGAHYTNNTDYDTGYNIVRDETTGRVTVSAPSAELGEVISLTQ
jgi:type IV pilus assembly protein PilA